MGIKSSKKTSVLKGCLVLMRPPNLPTAAADIITGAAIAGFFATGWVEIPQEIIVDFILLTLASVFLYAGGVVLNDVFDLKIDTEERPERPIPSGVVSLKTAAFLGGSLLFFGIILSFASNLYAGFVALCLAVSILLYDSKAKHHVFFGPLAMGFCRGLNLLLGMCILGLPPFSKWIYIMIPIIYIFGVTLISRGEVHGNNKKNIIFSAILYSLVIFFILFYNSTDIDVLLQVVPFLLLFGLAIFIPLVKAYKINSPSNIKKAVKAGVLSLVVMDAAIAASVSNWWVGIIILLLLPLSLFLSKRFLVT
ncbi:UbiA-like protein EboC [Confluentibacter flavum]|uniref:Ubiquinone biosynthesis protein UbiA n=1 Tax=Confluentibacter flavum TaxID=1909700 RepID=A0A2N3HIH4_9FLAO|nr:UbiA-like protein EboC [Confluentibacter flavum]PKQ44618.1 ubiquinone biosynthesis protein UbiA [Confluentibacter flavum]